MEKILIAEDDSAILGVITAFLTEAGYQVMTAKNGIEAYHLFQKETFDLIIMDIMMPSMDGYTNRTDSFYFNHTDTYDDGALRRR